MCPWPILFMSVPTAKWRRRSFFSATCCVLFLLVTSILYADLCVRAWPALCRARDAQCFFGKKLYYGKFTRHVKCIAQWEDTFSRDKNFNFKNPKNLFVLLDIKEWYFWICLLTFSMCGVPSRFQNLYGVIYRLHAEVASDLTRGMYE